MWHTMRYIHIDIYIDTYLPEYYECHIGASDTYRGEVETRVHDSRDAPSPRSLTKPERRDRFYLIFWPDEIRQHMDPVDSDVVGRRVSSDIIFHYTV